jgi:signal transduction histidine kinase/ligand-binding sensor domain-containing protein/CheY-like chemotaxis protein/AraC-like DNA-binding protein
MLLNLKAQEKAHEINFKHISYKEGLVQSPISGFLQDDKGFIWFGNLKGLTRYDGYEFKVYAHDESDENSISHNRVNVVYQDSRKNIWVGTANGLNLYNRYSETFTDIDVREIKGGRNYISSIVEDNSGNLWIGTLGGLKLLDKKNQKLLDLPKKDNKQALIYEPIYSLFIDKKNIIWVGTSEGLRKFNPNLKRFEQLPSSFLEKANFLNSRILVTKEDVQGNLWFGTEISGVFKYDRKLNRVTNYLNSPENNNSLSSNWVRDILVVDHQTIWFATRNGISSLNTKSNKFINYQHDPLDPNSLNDNAVWSLMKDRASCIWIGTFGSGINFYYKGNSNFQNIGESIGNTMGLNGALVNALTEDKDGTLWVGTLGGGLNHINLEQNTSKNYAVRTKNSYKSVSVKSLADDGKGNLWIGTSEGISLFNKQTKNLTSLSSPLFDIKTSKSLILTLLPDREGVWAGTNGGGLCYILPNGDTPVILQEKQPSTGWISGQNRKQQKLYLTDNFVSAIIKDKKGNLWIGTQNGLNYYDVKENKIKEQYRKYRDIKYQLSNSNITTLFFDSKERLWVGTEGGGLNYFDRKTKRFYAITKSIGLQDEVVQAVVEDQSNNLWVSTDLGIFNLKFKRFSVPFNKNDIEIINYSANDGLISNQFSTNAGLILKSKKIVFGGRNGLSIFYPHKIIKNTFAPKVVITKFLVNNKDVTIGTEGAILKKSITETDEIEVAYNQANLSFQFSGLNFINPYKNEYAYKLDRFLTQSDWQSLGNQREVNFANLSTGTYYFQLKAANNDGVWGGEIKTLKIRVLPPWWFTWWAYLIYITIFLIIAVVVIRFLRNRALLKRNLYLEHLHNERQQELYQMKLDFFTNISHEIRTPLTLILGPLEKIISDEQQHKYAKQLHLIKTNAERLMKLVTELLDFRKAEDGHTKIYFTYQDIIPFCEEIYQSFQSLAAEKHILYQFNTPKEPLFIYFDKNQLEKVIINLLSNAFKFTPDNGKITLNINHHLNDTNWIEISVVDNGKGIPKDKQDKLFESFFQVDDNGRHNIGSGIGLALAKSIVEMHKGKIKVSSNETSERLTTFTISLQIGRNHLQESEIVSEAVFKEDFKPTIQYDFQPLTEDVNSIKRKHKKYQLLIAEDNDDVRKLLVDTLIDDYHIVNFSNGLLAMQHLQNELPDLIISDVMMPEMDGITFCSQVKKQESTSHIPFILLTAKASVTHQVDGLSNGADVYLSKPFSPQVLALNIKNLLKAQEVMREKFSQKMVLQPSNLSVVTPEEKFINKLLQIIEDKMGDPDFDVNVLVNEIGMSRTVLYKKVQSLTNFAVADLIKQMRLKKAAELFKQTTFSISEVAYMVGFNDRKHFSKEFKKQFDLTPSEYIASNQNK